MMRVAGSPYELRLLATPMWQPRLGVFTPACEIISGFTGERKPTFNITYPSVPIRRVP